VECESSGTQPARLASLQPQRGGRRGGHGGLTANRQDCYPPHPRLGGGDSWRGGRQGVGGAPSPTKVSSVLRRRLAAYCDEG
jgi:hypothetical protein